MFGWHRTAQNPTIKKFWSVSGGGYAPPPNPPAGASQGASLDPLLTPIDPYIAGPPGLAAVDSHLRAYTRYVELYAQNCIK